MKVIHVCINILGRFLISLVFLAGAISKILHWQESERSLHGVLCDWQSSLGFSDALSDCIANLIPITPLLLLIATLCELIGGLLLLTGCKEKLGAFLLILFLIPATLAMHPFWMAEGPVRELQMIHFLKNGAILGGLLLFMLRESEANF